MTDKECLESFCFSSSSKSDENEILCENLTPGELLERSQSILDSGRSLVDDVCTEPFKFANNMEGTMLQNSENVLFETDNMHPLEVNYDKPIQVTRGLECLPAQEIIKPGTSILKKVRCAYNNATKPILNNINASVQSIGTINDLNSIGSSIKPIANDQNSSLNVPNYSGSFIKLQGQDSTRIIVDFDKNSLLKKANNETNVLFKEQNEISKNLCMEYCHICSRVFHNRKSRLYHLKKVHSISACDKRQTIICVDCDKLFKLKQEFRDHLQKFHNLDMTPKMLYFSTKEEFFTWKCNIERESFCSYHRKGHNTNKLCFRCSRSGLNYSNRKNENTELLQMRGSGNSIKLGITCPAEIRAEITPNGLIVHYFSTHYGHGSEMEISQISPAEKDAVNELTSKGFSFEKLMNELKGGEQFDNTLVQPLRKRILRWVNQSSQTPAYYAGWTDTHSISQWVQECCTMEESPILVCHLEDLECAKNPFVLIIMTEFQKQVFASNSKDVICVDTFYFSKRVLLVMYVIDELNSAFPVAYCIGNDLKGELIHQFFQCIRDHIGSISPKFFISNMLPRFYEIWGNVMGSHPRWLWNQWSITKAIQAKMQKVANAEKNQVFEMIKTIMYCKSVEVFECMFQNLINKLQTDESFKTFGAWLLKKFQPNTDKWASCFRKDISFMTTHQFSSLHHAFHIACQKASKEKQLFRLLHILMKVVRNKIIDRILDSFDEEKVTLALHAIGLCHEKSMVIPGENITMVCDKLWNVKCGFNEDEFVTQETDSCPDHCRLKCKQCSVCVHMFSCSCVNNMVHSNMCKHIHAVSSKFFQGTSPELSSNSGLQLDGFTSATKFHNTNPFGSNLETSACSLLQTNFQDEASTSNSSSMQFTGTVQAAERDYPFLSKHVAHRRNQQDALERIMYLYNCVKNNNLKESTLTALTKRLSECQEIVTRNHGDYSSTPSSVPINAVYVIKQKKPTTKRSRHNLSGESNAEIKRFKSRLTLQQKLPTKEVMPSLLSNQEQVRKFPQAPLMLVLSNSSQVSEQVVSEN